MRITYGPRTVLTTDGTIINLLPPSYDLNTTFNIVFPDIRKGWSYNWRHSYSYTSLGNQVGYSSRCNSFLTALPQEYSDETTVAAAPSGSDIFIGRITLTRTGAPSHTWNGQVIQPLQPVGQIIPFVSGSLLTEAVFGMSRAFSLYVSGGSLRLHRQQSVGPPPGGWGMYGTSFNYLSPANGSGGENVNQGEDGLPILEVSANQSADYQQQSQLFSDPYSQRSRLGYTGFGAATCTIPNLSNYNYSSTYQATLTGSFGRRS